jgi:hypothetical protein
VFSVKHRVYAAEKFPAVTEDDMLRESTRRKLRTSAGSPRPIE